MTDEDIQRIGRRMVERLSTPEGKEALREAGERSRERARVEAERMRSSWEKFVERYGTRRTPVGR